MEKMRRINLKVNDKGLSHLTQQYLNKIMTKENENGPKRIPNPIHAVGSQK